MRRERSPFDETGGVNGHVAEAGDRAGALGLSHDKMALVREKKEEIEKVRGEFSSSLKNTFWCLFEPYEECGAGKK